jgi:transcriptional regulator with XRE-family HTH domain
MQVMKDLIKRLEKFRLENKIPQERLAKDLGVAFSTVNRWFNGKSNPNKIQTYQIQKLLSRKTKYKSKQKGIVLF